jgi:hypothetical protein
MIAFEILWPFIFKNIQKGPKFNISLVCCVHLDPVLEKDISSQRALEIFSVSYFSPVGLPPEEPPPELLRDVLRSLALE